MFVGKEIENSNNTTAYKLPNKIVDSYELDESVQQCCIEPQAQKNDAEKKCCLRVDVFARAVLERPDLLQYETNAESQPKRNNGRVEVPYAKVVRQHEYAPEIGARRDAASNDESYDAQKGVVVLVHTSVPCANTVCEADSHRAFIRG